MRKIIIAIVLLAPFFTLKAQDFQYSQFYAAPLYLNPALTGSTELSRIGVNYRKQWPGLSHDFNVYSAYFDHYSIDLNSGFGIAVHSFNESNMKLSTTDISLLYSYKLKLAETWEMSFGLQGAWVSRNAVLDNLVFGDQINLFSKTVDPFSDDHIPDVDPYSYLDISSGILVSNNVLWFGLSSHHLNEPNLSFFPDNTLNSLPRKWTFHGGVNLPLGSNDQWGSKYDNQASILFSYKKQGPFQQFDLGTQLYYQNFIGGLGYRGIPGLRDMPNHDSIILLLGLEPPGLDMNGRIIIGYSYDFMISGIASQTKGSHEISLRFTFFQGTEKTRGKRTKGRAFSSCTVRLL